MKRNPTLFQTKKAFLKKELLYRQRFDACPHFMFFVGEAHSSDTNKSKYPFGQRITTARFSRNTADWYHLFSELEYTAHEILRRATSDVKIINKMIAEFAPWEKKFYRFCKELEKKDLSKLSKTQLLTEYQKLAGVYVKKLNPSPLIDGFALTTDRAIAEKIKTFLKEKNLEKNFVAYFEILTAPTFLSFLQEEEVAFLNRAIQISQHPALKKKVLQEHQQEFFWIHNNYVSDAILGKEFFEEKLSRYADLDLKERTRELNSLPQQNERRKEELIQKLSLPEEIRMLLFITDHFNKWQDERKKGTFWATHYFSLLLQEVAHRTEYTLEELKYALPPEMEEILAGKIEKQELRKRFQDCFLVFTLDNFDLTSITKEIEEVLKKKEEVLDTELRGMSVSLGKVVGRVKIIETVQEIKKVQKGDILVAVMTRPDYVPAMEKAAAFVTEEGGLTCHAAIVAREMKVPCIVGVKDATKTLQDGMIVEVNANHGWIRILEQAEAEKN